LCFRFKNLAWRLLQLLPSNDRLASSEEKSELFHFCTALSFQNYNRLLENGFLVSCADNKVRRIVIVLSQWQGDQPEIDRLNGSIQVGGNVPVCLYVLF
jgi:hypothetical protein